MSAASVVMRGGAAWPELRARLRGTRQRAEDFRRLHRRAGRAVLDWVERNFDAEGRLDQDFPAGWPPLAPSTRAARRRRGRAGRILRDTGRLRAGFTLRADQSRVRIGNPVAYAARHQLGLGVPRRPFFPGAGQLRRIVDPIVDGFLAEAIS